MPVLTFESEFPCSLEELWAFHSSTEALKFLTPPSKKVELLSTELEVKEGAKQKIKTWQWGIPMIWEVRIHDVGPNGFTDTATKSPFKFWSHRHQFDFTPTGSKLTDTITYEMPFGLLGQIVDTVMVKKDLESAFKFRHEATRKALTNV